MAPSPSCLVHGFKAAARPGAQAAPLLHPRIRTPRPTCIIRACHIFLSVQEAEELREIEAAMAEAAEALIKRQEMPQRAALEVIAASADHMSEVFSGHRPRDRPWWDGREQRVWQLEVDGAGTPSALAYLLGSLLTVSKRLVDFA